jgi:hypothetical protein
MLTLRPGGLDVQRCRSSPAAQVHWGEVHGLAGSKAMADPAGQVSCLVAKSRAKLVLP